MKREHRTLPNPFQSKVTESLLLFCKGAIVGTGAILPGVSGGVLCVAFGIYEPMMELLAHPIKSLRRYYKMLIPFLIGWTSGFVLLARLLESFFSVSSAAAMMLFAGLIFGSIPELMIKSSESGQNKGWTPFVVVLVSFYILFQLLSQNGITSIRPNCLWYIFCGLVWGLSLVIPGLSSSSVLIFMGLYEPMISGIASLDPFVIIPLSAGLLITAALTARFVNLLFEKQYAFMSRIIIGIMVASTMMILPSEFDSLLNALMSIVCFMCGFIISRWMDILRLKKNNDQYR